MCKNFEEILDLGLGFWTGVFLLFRIADFDFSCQIFGMHY